MPVLNDCRFLRLYSQYEQQFAVGVQLCWFSWQVIKLSSVPVKEQLRNPSAPLSYTQS